MVCQVSESVYTLGRSYPVSWNTTQTVLGCCGWNVTGIFWRSCEFWFGQTVCTRWLWPCGCWKKHFTPCCLLHCDHLAYAAATNNRTYFRTLPFNHGIEPCSVLFLRHLIQMCTGFCAHMHFASFLLLSITHLVLETSASSAGNPPMLTCMRIRTHSQCAGLHG